MHAHARASAISKAIIKAMLNSPVADYTGWCTLFSSADFNNMKGRPPAFLDKLTKANDAITQVDCFLRAYGNFSPEALQKLISKIEVDAVMWLFQKKAAARTFYAEIIDVMAACIDSAKKEDHKLPDMPLLKQLQTQKHKKRKVGLQELAGDGVIANDALIEKGYKVDARIEEKTGKRRKFRITALNGDQKLITAVDEDDSTSAALEIKRSDLYSMYTVLQENSITVVANIPCPLSICHQDIVTAAVRQTLSSQFSSSSENNVQLQMRVAGSSTTLELTVNKKFGAGKLKLVPMGCNFIFSEERLPHINIGTTRQTKKSKKIDAHIYIKSANSPLKMIIDHHRGHLKKDAQVLVSKFFVAYSKMTDDARIANSELTHDTFEAKIGADKLSFKVPFITNSIELEAGDKIVVLSHAPADA